jgi:Lipocalin / cytosolic fatty-acid binding protein family
MKMYPHSVFALIPQNRKGFLRLLSLPIITALINFSLTAADLAGTWKGSMQTQVGETQVILMIQPGSGLAGKVKLGDYDGTMEKGKVAGDKISFETTVEPGKLTFEGTVTADQMELNVTGTQGDKYTLVCQRQK